MKNTQLQREKHELLLKLNFVARLWVKWNKREISGDAFALQLQKGLSKEIQKAWNKEICRVNEEKFGNKKVETLEDLLV